MRLVADGMLWASIPDSFEATTTLSTTTYDDGSCTLRYTWRNRRELFSVVDGGSEIFKAF